MLCKDNDELLAIYKVNDCARGAPCMPMML
jgi:hypothetical protein